MVVVVVVVLLLLLEPSIPTHINFGNPQKRKKGGAMVSVWGSVWGWSNGVWGRRRGSGWGRGLGEGGKRGVRIHKFADANTL